MLVPFVVHCRRSTSAVLHVRLWLQMCGFVTTGVLLASSNNQPAQVSIEYSLVSPKNSLSFAIPIFITLPYVQFNFLTAAANGGIVVVAIEMHRNGVFLTRQKKSLVGIRFTVSHILPCLRLLLLPIVQKLVPGNNRHPWTTMLYVPLLPLLPIMALAKQGVLVLVSPRVYC